MPTPDAEHERDSSLVPLKRPLSLRETVLEQLRTAIITGRLAEGEVVSAPALGVTLGVSATPVREAMMDLAREGLVETLKNKGFRVTTMSESDLDDLAQIRLLLEPPAMRLIAGRVPEADLPKLRSLADACLEATDRGDLEEYLRFDREFHAPQLGFEDVQRDQFMQARAVPDVIVQRLRVHPQRAGHGLHRQRFRR